MNRHDDMSRRVAPRLGRDRWRDLGDRRALDQNVAPRVIAHPWRGSCRPLSVRRTLSPTPLGIARPRRALRLSLGWRSPSRRCLCREDATYPAFRRGKVADDAHRFPPPNPHSKAGLWARRGFLKRRQPSIGEAREPFALTIPAYDKRPRCCCRPDRGRRRRNSARGSGAADPARHCRGRPPPSRRGRTHRPRRAFAP